MKFYYQVIFDLKPHPKETEFMLVKLSWYLGQNS